MTKMFAMITGWVLIVIGILNFFLTSPVDLKVKPVHAILHIVVGLLGVGLMKMHRGYTMWVGIGGVLLAIIGFAGVKDILNIVDFTTSSNWIHAVIGVVGLLVFFMAKGAGSAPKPAAAV
ncbi:MAG: DUF4383 domain-containing protein [Ilumatobacteraceae bacterium]